MLLETGIGAFFSPKFQRRFGVVEQRHVLLENLNALGLTHSDIDIVLLSHLHFDHAGGLLESYQESKEPDLLFPNATFICSNKAFLRACNPHARDKASFIPHLQRQLQDSGRLVLVEEEHCPLLGPDFRFIYSNGHTPGLLCTEIQTQIGPILFGADLIPGSSWVHTPITMGYDRFPELLIDEKTEILQSLVDRSGYIFFTHDHKVALARIVQDERGRFTTTLHQEHLLKQRFIA
ncbi:MAG: MBL fold hydrolase [Deltaproteobacteria bacterium]|nr:MBL fold hydrolase [Deltaproteobacteria bacterium]